VTRDLAVYRLVKALSDSTKGADLVDMLEWVNGAVRMLQGSKTFKRVARDVIGGELEDPFREISANAKALADEHPEFEMNHEVLLWLIGMRVANHAQDFKRSLIETCLFIAAQEAGVYRVRDDKLRLVLTYLHVMTLKRMAEEVA
jgi:hypothetical protein